MTVSWKERTRGGVAGHRLRRVIHVFMFLVPWVYDLYGRLIAAIISLSRTQFVIAVAILVAVFEVIRLAKGWVFFGQRNHESSQLSSFFWGGISMALVFLLAPDRAYYIPIITVCSWVDPLLGGLRAKEVPSGYVFIIGLIFAWLIWGASYFCLGSSPILGFVFGFLAVFFEKFNWRWVDDNALMQLIPLLAYVLFLAI